MNEVLNVGIAGLGTVGTGVVKILDEQSDLLRQRSGKKIKISAVCARDKSKDRGINLDKITWYDDANDLVKDDKIDVIIELIGGDSGIAYDLALGALNSGKHFITANKALIAKHGFELANLAEEKSLYLAFEAAVAGGIPIIKALKEGLAGNEITKIQGILNGTCNYILTAMKETGRDFEDILTEAQELGYAEADPTFDVDGIDAAHKLAILTSMALGGKVSFDDVYIEGIRNISLIDVEYAKMLGFKVKLLGVCKAGKQAIRQWVYPCLIDEKSPISGVDGVDNAVLIKADAVQQLMLRGPGAGSGPTASAVVADIIDLAAGRTPYAFNIPANDLQEQKFKDISKRNGAYYIRVSVHDVPGVLANIADILRIEGVSMETIMQKPIGKANDVHIVGITHRTDEFTIHNSIDRIKEIKSVIDDPVVLRVER